MVSDRAGQFMPFSALRGFYDLIREKERVIVPRHDIAQDKAEELDIKLKAIEKGNMVRIVYYYDGEYLSAEGIVSKIDYVSGKLMIVKTQIAFEDIWDIE